MMFAIVKLFYFSWCFGCLHYFCCRCPFLFCCLLFRHCCCLPVQTKISAKSPLLSSKTEAAATSAVSSLMVMRLWIPRMMFPTKTSSLTSKNFCCCRFHQCLCLLVPTKILATSPLVVKNSAQLALYSPFFKI